MGPSLQLSTAVLGLSTSVLVFLGYFVFALSGAPRGTDGGKGRCHGNEVTRGRRRGVLMTPAKYEVDWSTGGEVMGIFCKLGN